jgi:hypothetical protein
MLSLIDTWIKAAMERRVLLIDYVEKTDLRVHTNVEVEPYSLSFCEGDFRKGLYGFFKGKGTLTMDPVLVLGYKIAGGTFESLNYPGIKRIEALYKRKELRYKRFC